MAGIRRTFAPHSCDTLSRIQNPQEIEVDFEGTTSVRTFGNIYRDKIWLTRQGDLIPVYDMSSTHLQNCINKIDNNTLWRREWKAILEEELARRKGMPTNNVPKRRIRMSG